MTSTKDSDSRRIPRFERARRARLPLAAAAIVFAGLWAIGALAATPALAGYLLVALAALIGARRTEAALAPLPSNERRPPGIGDPLLEAVLAALPDPAV